MLRRCHLIYDKQKNTYIVLFKGDDTDFAWNQEIALEIETDLDLTGFTAKFSVLGFVQDFDDITSKKLNLVFPAEETSKFPLGMTDAVFEVFDTDGKKRTIINTLKVLVTKSVYEAYSNEDPQAITVSISGTIEREQSDWTETDTSSPSFIKHKPDLGEKLDGDAVYEKWYDSDYYEPDTIVSHNGYLWKCIRFTPEEPSDSAEDWEMIRAEYVFAPKDSPNLIGTPTAPTAPAGTNTEQIATTAFVASSLQGHIPEPSSQTPLEDGIGSPGTGNKFSRNDHVHPHDSSKQDKLSQEQLNNINSVPSKAPLASPELTGTPTAPTAASGTNTTQIANTAFVHGAVSGKADTSDVVAALALKASLADIPYRLVVPGEDWRYSFAGVPDGVSIESAPTYSSMDSEWDLYVGIEGVGEANLSAAGDSQAASISFDLSQIPNLSGVITATRTPPGHLLDRAGNRVEVTGDTTLTLPAANPGYLRDFLVRLEISGSTVPAITFAAPTGETITYETDGDEFPVPDEAGTWSYSFTENCAAHKFAVSLKKVNEVAAPQAQGGS